MKYQLTIQKEMAQKTESEKTLKIQLETLLEKSKKNKEKL
jgi:hypothetical protein